MPERTARDVVRDAGREPLTLLTSVQDYRALLKAGAELVSCVAGQGGTHLILVFEDLCFAYIDPVRRDAH